jgi:hypothetical protein
MLRRWYRRQHTTRDAVPNDARRRAMPEKSPQKPAPKKAGKTLLEKRAVKREKKDKGKGSSS